MASSGCTRLFLSPIPDLKYLEAFEGHVLDCYTIPAIKAKCRELVRGDALLLASPNKNKSQHLVSKRNDLTNVWIITKKNYTNENAAVQQKLEQLKIKVTRQVSVNMDMMSTCYHFTLTARLAPKWNVIGDWIVKGCDIFKTGRAQALKLEVNITAKEISIAVTALKMTVNFFKPDDLNVSTVLINQFKREPQLIINESAITTNRCFVLPNFTQAHIFSAAHSVSSSSTFNSFDKIRLHWKKQYGYILPDSQNLFYEVFFKFNPGTFFSYPGCCVTTSHPVVCPSKDTDLLATCFINDIHSRLPSLCGQQIKYSKKPVMSSTGLLPVHHIETHPNTKPLSNNSITLGKPNLLPLGRDSSQVVPNTRTTVHNNKDEAAVPVVNYNSYNKQMETAIMTQPHTTPLGDRTNGDSYSESDSRVNGRTKRPLTRAPSSVSKRFCSNDQNTNPDTIRVVPSLGSELISTPSLSINEDTSMNTKKQSINKDTIQLLQRTKASSLKEWLKREGVLYSSREKKDDLIRKVVHCLQENGQKEFKI